MDNNMLLELGTSFTLIMYIKRERDTIQLTMHRMTKLSTKRHTSAQHAVTPNHAPPSIFLPPSNLHSVIRYHLKKPEFEDFLKQTSPVIPHFKIKKTFISWRKY